MELPKECFVVGYETQDGTIRVTTLIGGTYGIETRDGDYRQSVLDRIVTYDGYGDAIVEAMTLQREGVGGFEPKDGKTEWQVYKMKLEAVPLPVLERVGM